MLSNDNKWEEEAACQHPFFFKLILFNRHEGGAVEAKSSAIGVTFT
jgi:hypothetical protein